MRKMTLWFLILGLACLLPASGARAQLWSDDFEDGDMSDWVVESVGADLTPENEEAWALVDRGLSPTLRYRSGDYSAFNMGGSGSADGETTMSIVVPEAAGVEDLTISLWLEEINNGAFEEEDVFAVTYRLSTATASVTHYFQWRDGLTQSSANWKEIVVPVEGVPTASFEISLYSEVSASTKQRFVDDVALFVRPTQLVFFDDFEGGLDGWTTATQDSDGNPINDTSIITADPSLWGSSGGPDNGGVISGTKAVYAGMLAFNVGRVAEGDQAWMTRVIPIPRGSGARVSLWIRQDKNTADFGGDNFWELSYRTAPTAGWTELWDLDDDGPTQNPWLAGNSSRIGGWRHYYADVADGGANFEVRIRFDIDEYDTNWWMDDFKVEAIPGGIGRAVRQIPSPAFIPEIPTEIRVVAQRGALAFNESSNMTVSEAIPLGLSLYELSATEGSTATVTLGAGGEEVIVWETILGTSGNTTLTYSVIPPMSSDLFYLFTTGTYTIPPVGLAWEGLSDEPLTGPAALRRSNTLAASNGTPVVRINFQPGPNGGANYPVETLNSSETLTSMPEEWAPDGYFRDIGLMYGLRDDVGATGWSYGWLDVGTTDTLTRNVKGDFKDRNNYVNAPDERFDTLLAAQNGVPHFWQIEIANGTYEVVIGAGDPNSKNQDVNWLVEGVESINVPRGILNLVSVATSVTVTDGVLEIAHGPSAVANKICFVDILEPGTAPTLPAGTLATPGFASIEVDWSYAASDAWGFVIERSNDQGEFVEIDAASASERSFVDKSVASNVIYSYRIRAFNDKGSGKASLPATAFNSAITTPTEALPTDLLSLDISGWSEEGDFLYQWYVNDEAVVGATSSTLAGAFVKDDLVYCRVWAFDGVNLGDMVQTDGITILAGFGPPTLAGVDNLGSATLGLNWTNESKAPERFIGFAYDLYEEQWVDGSPNGTIWYNYSSAVSTGEMNVGNAGAYFVWISNLYEDAGWFPCDNPAAIMAIGGAPHTPLDMQSAAVEGENKILLQWKPDIYGAWLYWVILYHVETQQWVVVGGPQGQSTWQYYLYGTDDYMNGSTEITVPGPGTYRCFLASMGWDAESWSEFAVSTSVVGGGM